ncbi:Fic family protein [Thiotrichales bacterium 19X7-9]|nr:Fic family protein [Thiotrichales bacterium 19X7-9]
MSTDPYLYPNSNVLKNKFDLYNQDDLNKIEKEIYDVKIQMSLPKGNFNYNHLKAIHKFLFEDIYDWAGQERLIDIAKDNSLFAKPTNIKHEIDKIFYHLLNESFDHFDHYEMCEKIAKYFNDVNVVHPFREGNGRVNRAFFSMLAKKYGYKINWSNIDKNRLFWRNMLKLIWLYKNFQPLY